MSTATDAVDVGRLDRWLATHGIPLEAPLEASELGQGKSNLTYTVTDRAARRVVLRRPPIGPLLPTAHDVLREARIIDALAGTGVPVPQVLATCDDDAVIGAPFAILEYVDGHVLRDSETAARASATCRRRVGGELVDALGALHATDVHAIGLGDLARDGGYVERQLRRWRRQWLATADRPLPLMDDAHAALEAAPPEQQRVTLVHSDPKLDNCIVSDDGTLRALIDWELATVGDPLADLGLMLAFWAEPADDATALQDPATTVEGFARRDELVARYAAATGLDLAPLPRYLAFSYWKIACIVQGVIARRRDTWHPDALAPFRQQVERLATMAARTLDA